MTKEQFIKELEHIAESGSNEIRLGNLFDLVIAQDRESRWISVKDRLPDKNGFVAVHKHNGMVFACFFDYDMKFKYSDVDQTDQITHWQPLPESPKL